MKEMKTLTLNGEQYRITDALAARINDNASGPDSTWSGEKIAAGLQEVTDLAQQAIDLAQTAGREALDNSLALLGVDERVMLQERKLTQLETDKNTMLNAINNGISPTLESHTQTLGEHNGAINELFTQLYGIVNDDMMTSASTWSSNKLYGMFGEVESALDAILAMQNSLIGGGSV